MEEERITEVLDSHSDDTSTSASTADLFKGSRLQDALARRKVSLRVVLKDSVARTFFEEFLSKEHADEAYQFYRRVEEFRKEPSEEKRRKAARDIYDNFISADGPLQVFVSVPVAEDIKAALGELFVSTELFSAAQREVLSSLRCDNFGRFCTSALFDTMMRGIDGRAAVVDPIVFATFLELSVNERGEAWQRFVEYNELEVFKWIKSVTSHESLVVKARLHFDYSARSVFDVVSSPEVHEIKFDPACTSAELVRQIGKDFKVIFTMTNESEFSRYSILGQAIRELEDGKFAVIYRSLDWPKELLSQGQQDVVDLRVMNDFSISGYLIEPAGAGCVVTKLTQIDVTAPITTQLMKKVTKSRSDVLWRLRLYMATIGK